MLTCNILLLWDHVEAKILFIPKFLLRHDLLQVKYFAKAANYRDWRAYDFRTRTSTSTS